MLISAAKFARKYFYEDKNNGGVLIFFIAVSLLVEVAKLLVINFFKAVNKNQNIFTIFDNFSLVRDQIKILTLYRSLYFENSHWRQRQLQSMSPLIYQGHLVRRVSV